MTTLAVAERPPSKRTQVLGDSTRSLRDSLLAAATRIRCEFAEGMLILNGDVRSYRHKQLAQECTREIAGVEQIVNRLRVVR